MLVMSRITTHSSCVSIQNSQIRCESLSKIHIRKIYLLQSIFLHRVDHIQVLSSASEHPISALCAMKPITVWMALLWLHACIVLKYSPNVNNRHVFDRREASCKQGRSCMCQGHMEDKLHQKSCTHMGRDRRVKRSCVISTIIPLIVNTRIYLRVSIILALQVDLSSMSCLQSFIITRQGSPAY